MNRLPGSQRGSSSDTALQSRQQAALLILLQAWDFAHANGSDLWDYAEEMEHLRTPGLSNGDFRWLIERRLILHAEEVSRPSAKKRRFTKCGQFALPRRTCFVLTDEGARLARRIAAVQDQSQVHSLAGRDRHMPAWDRERRELTVGQTLVKRYRRPAPNQEKVLDVFQEEGWPHRIDDPLPPPLDRDARQCLHDTINHLNRNQLQALIHFSGDGNGCGICWEFACVCIRRRTDPHRRHAAASTIIIAPTASALP